MVLRSTKLGSMPALVVLIPTNGQSINKLAFLPLQKGCRSCVTGLLNTTVMMFVWNLQVSIGFLFLIFYRRITSGLLFLTPNISSLKKATRQIVKMPNGFVIYICVELLSLPLFPQSNEPSGHSF